MMAALLYVTASMMWSLTRVGAFWFSIPQSDVKCVSEEIHSNVIVVADYNVFYIDQFGILPTVSSKVISPNGNILHQQENITSGSFAFTTTESGSYQACFWVENYHKNIEVNLNLDWKIGITAKDWDTVAKKENIEGVELGLRKMEEAIEIIQKNMLNLKIKEAWMRATSEQTNSRVLLYSTMSLGICIASSVLQLWYLNNFFHKKKLI
ncbi:Transmembrane emp24 domain-containing protein p24delta3 [Zostera marina]|uniref:Transmembrane emp24 domain-containing protein p24delta3 n=1 Tax=Zostera marina TaxID=29655 RepID=A0A0K9PF92_ZOSMR|nr:Transmembrane emp24 domain-containing protein p24delta3 [Zostera marina]